jgi:hypothetical protein
MVYTAKMLDEQLVRGTTWEGEEQILAFMERGYSLAEIKAMLATQNSKH